MKACWQSCIFKICFFSPVETESSNNLATSLRKIVNILPVCQQNKWIDCWQKLKFCLRTWQWLRGQWSSMVNFLGLSLSLKEQVGKIKCLGLFAFEIPCLRFYWLCVLYMRISNLQANVWTVCKPVSACLKVNWWSVISQKNGDPTKLWRCPFNRISLEDFIKTIFFLACNQVPNPHCRQKIECLSVYSLSLSLSRWFYPWGCWKVKLQ